MSDLVAFRDQLTDYFKTTLETVDLAYDQLNVCVDPASLSSVCRALRDESIFEFKQLIDLCGIDYLSYGQSDWPTQKATETGFARGVSPLISENTAEKSNMTEPSIKQCCKRQPRFAVIYHLLSLTHNRRLRLKVFLSEEHLSVDSVEPIWVSARWYEREAFDLFGIFFEGHSDLRRLLTDYGFVGHPFRKDFPLIGKVEARYDATLARVIYEPVSIEPRILEPKVIRKDHRYQRPSI